MFAFLCIPTWLGSAGCSLMCSWGISAESVVHKQVQNSRYAQIVP